MAQLIQYHLWDLPTRGQDPQCDGAGWILEAVKGGHYHIVDRWSPPNLIPSTSWA